jgi:Regulator of chromosome condensation (RCC1) repeat
MRHCLTAALAGALVLTSACSDEPTTPQKPDMPLAMQTTGTPEVQVTAGAWNTCAMRLDGTVLCWGTNGDGESVAPAGAFHKVSLGWSFGCAQREDGTVACWGYNGDGRATAPAGTFLDIDAGSVNTCGLRLDGTLACWGFNEDGQGSPPVGSFTQVSAGRFIGCAIDQGAALHCWGLSQYLADQPPGSFTKVSVGYEHACAIRTDNTLACWAYNGLLTPETDAPSGTFTAVDAGRYATCAIRSTGTLSCWGRDAHPILTLVPQGTFRSLSVGVEHACAVRTDQVILCWGTNFDGESAVPAEFGPPGATPTGAQVSVRPVDPATGNSPVTLTYNSVSAAGVTSITTTSQGAPPPSGFKLGNPPVYFDLSTTATYTGAITVCFGYSAISYANAANIKLFHGNTDGTWTNVTTSNNTTTQVICGSVTSLSPFVLAELRYDFRGFFQPVDNAPTQNKLKAGSAVPIKFSLGGDMGLDIFAPQFPNQAKGGCPNTTTDIIEETVTAGSSGLSYDPVSSQYTYVWKTDKLWANTCRVLMIELKDRTTHTALFTFTK